MAKAKTKTKDKDIIIILFIVTGLAAFMVYVNSIGNDFVFDDDSVVLGDPTITSLSNIPNYFTGAQGFHKVIGRYYRPVVSTSYAIDYSIWKFNPVGFHLTNVLIHVFNSLLFLKLLLMIFAKNTAQDSSARDVSERSKAKLYFIFLGSLIFAVHPIHTEAVAWVSGRTDSLSCTFFFAAFICYLKFSDEPRNKSLILLLVFYLLALLAKEMAITLPVVVILYDLIVNRLDFKRLWHEKKVVYLALILLSILYLLLRWSVLRDVPERTTYNYFYGKDFWIVAFTMLQTIPLYFRLAFAPYDMLYHYSGYMPYRDSFLDLAVLVPAVFLLIMIFCSVYLRKSIPVLSYSILFFFITLVPVLNIVPTMNFMADRFLYIPSVIASLAFVSIVLKYHTGKNISRVYGLAAAIILGYCYLTVARNADWKDNDTLFLSADNRQGIVTYVNIGNIYANKQQFDTAEVYYRKAIDLRAETVLANNNLGKVFLVRGNFDSAYYYMYRAHLLDTLSPEPMHALAQLHATFDKIPNAILWLERIQKITPGYMNSDKMLIDLNNRLKMDTQPKLEPEVYKQTAILEQSSYKHYQEKKYDKAIEELLMLSKLNPSGRVGYYNNAGMCYLESGRYKEAVKYFELSIKEKPDFSTAYNNLGDCYANLGENQKALENYRKAAEIDPNNQAAKQNIEKLEALNPRSP